MSTQRSRGPSPSARTGRQAGHLLGAERIKPVGPDSVRYVNFLACQGYVVEILGGKHFKTPEGEFVEMKSGTQYKIHVKNTHAYGKVKIHYRNITKHFNNANKIYAL